ARARAGEEQVPGPHLPAVHRDPRDREIGNFGRAGEIGDQLRKLHRFAAPLRRHDHGAATVPATATGASGSPAASGGTLRMRSVPRMTSANTGAATWPP